MPDTTDFTIPHGGKQPAGNPNHIKAAEFLRLVWDISLSLRQLEVALSTSLTIPIEASAVTTLLQKLHESGTAAVIGLTSDSDNEFLSAILEWRQIPNEGGADNV